MQKRAILVKFNQNTYENNMKRRLKSGQWQVAHNLLLFIFLFTLALNCGHQSVNSLKVLELSSKEPEVAGQPTAISKSGDELSTSSSTVASELVGQVSQASQVRQTRKKSRKTEDRMLNKQQRSSGSTRRQQRPNSECDYEKGPWEECQTNGRCNCSRQ